MAFTNYESFKKDVYKMTKIDLNAYKEKQMKRRIDTLATKNKCTTYEQYLSKLTTDKKLFDEFVNFLTINVSEFYRNPDQWEILDKEIIPDLIKRYGKNLKIWSAACSTGDEPYSLVMALSRHLPLNMIKIHATDIDKKVIEQAKAGLYSKRSIAGVPDDLKKKFFTKIGESYQISEEVKKRVTFQNHDLLKDKYPDNCHLIVCRNVVIYFTEDAKNVIYDKFNKSLVKDGYLFIGSTEQIINFKDLNFRRSKSFFFQKGRE